MGRDEGPWGARRCQCHVPTSPPDVMAVSALSSGAAADTGPFASSCCSLRLSGLLVLPSTGCCFLALPCACCSVPSLLLMDTCQLGTLLGRARLCWWLLASCLAVGTPRYPGMRLGSPRPLPASPCPMCCPTCARWALWSLAGPEGLSGAGPWERPLLAAVPCRVREKNLLFLFISAKARQRGLPK